MGTFCSFDFLLLRLFSHGTSCPWDFLPEGLFTTGTFYPQKIFFVNFWVLRFFIYWTFCPRDFLNLDFFTHKKSFDLWIFLEAFELWDFFLIKFIQIYYSGKKSEDKLSKNKLSGSLPYNCNASKHFLRTIFALWLECARRHDKDWCSRGQRWLL